jgi:hypothetical protein
MLPLLPLLSGIVNMTKRADKTKRNRNKYEKEVCKISNVRLASQNMWDKLVDTLGRDLDSMYKPSEAIKM